jgi:hypothetical protein
VSGLTILQFHDVGFLFATMRLLTGETLLTHLSLVVVAHLVLESSLVSTF